ncbi:MAG: hypothetical protein O3C10_08405 [Chloroflexi bacterium]|nr:hypothetical protein [Chloroflexota bacterium]
MTTLATPIATRLKSRFPASAPGATEEHLDQSDEFARAVIDSVVTKRGETLSVSLQSEAEAISISSRIELLLLTVGMGVGSCSVRVAPSFLGHTYPAMRSLAVALDESGLSGVWSGVDGRSIRLVDAWQLFISVDAPSARQPVGQPDRPDTLLEVVSADRISTDWYRNRVAPRSSAKGLTTVFYGPAVRSADGGESLFDRVRRSNLTKEWRDGVRRHFDATAQRAGVSSAS